MMITAHVDRFNIVSSPQFNVKINNTTITMVLDTGATGSMISIDLCKMIGLKVYPTPHSAISANGDSQLSVAGEVHTSILMDDFLTLPLSAVVVTKLKSGLIVGMAFMKENKIVIDIPNCLLQFPGNKISRFNNQPGHPKVSLLRADVNYVVFPGESISLPTPINFSTDTELAIEPREDNFDWYNPGILTGTTQVF